MAETLETLIVKLIADDGDLEKQLKSIVDKAKKYGQTVSKAFSGSSSNGFKKQADEAEIYRRRLRNLDADVRRNAVSTREGARQFDALTKEMVKQRNLLNPLSKGYEQLSVQISRSASSADRLRGRINGLSFANQIKSANSFAHSMRTIHAEIAVLVGALGINRLVRGLNDASNSYYDAVIAQRLYDRELQKAGISQAQGAATVAALAAELRTTDDIIQNGSVQLLRYGASLQQTEVLLRAGAASGLAFRRTTADGIEAIAQAIVGEQSQILNRIGIAGNLSTAYVQYARDLGVSTDALTQQQKVQAALNMILRETATEIESLPILFDGLAGAKNRYSVATTLASRAVGEEFEPSLTALYNAGADLLMLFTDDLVPVLAQQFNPIVESGTAKVTNFVTRLTDTGQAGIELRAQMVSLGVVVGTVAEGFGIAGSFVFGFTSDILGLVAATGAAIGDLSVQFGGFFRQFGDAGLGFDKLFSTNPNDIVAGMAILSNTFKNFTPPQIDWQQTKNSAEFARQDYVNAAVGAYASGFQSIDNLQNLPSNLKKFFDSLAEGGGEGVKNTLSTLTDINEAIEETGEGGEKSSKKIRTFVNAITDYQQGLKEINLTYDMTGDKQKALEEQLRLTESTFKELVSLALSDGILSDFERENIKLFADDIDTVTGKIAELTKAVDLSVKPIVNVAQPIAVGPGVYDKYTGTTSEGPLPLISVIPESDIPKPEAFVKLSNAIDITNGVLFTMNEYGQKSAVVLSNVKNAVDVTTQPFADVADAIDVTNGLLYKFNEYGQKSKVILSEVADAVDVTTQPFATLSQEVDVATGVLFRFTEGGGKTPRVFADVTDAVDVSTQAIVQYKNSLNELKSYYLRPTESQPSLDFIFGGGKPQQTLNFLPPEFKEFNQAITIINALADATARLGATSPELAKFSEGLAETASIAVDLAASIASGDVIAIIGSSIKAVGYLVSEFVDIFRDRVAEGIKEIASQYEYLSESTIAALSKKKKEVDFFLFIPYQVEVIDEEASKLGYNIANNIANGIVSGLADADFSFAEFFDNMLLQLKAQAIVNLDSTQAFIVEYTKLIQRVLDGTATQQELAAFESDFIKYLNDRRSELGLKPSASDTNTKDSTLPSPSPIQYGSSPSAISFAVNADFLEGSRNMNKAALILIDVFGGAGVPEMNVTTTGAGYASFSSTVADLTATYGRVITMYNRVLDEGITINTAQGKANTSTSPTARKR